MTRNIPGARLAFAFLVVLSTMSAVAAGANGSDRDRGANDVRPLFGLDNPSDGPFPSDRFVVVDGTQNTCVRVALPKPASCAGEESECLELDLLNELDGFNLRPRLSIPFDGPIDLATVNSETIFLVSLGSTLVDGAPSCPSSGEGESEDDQDEHDGERPPGAGWVVGINQVVWDPADPKRPTLHVEADETLDQHTRYALIVTRGVRDASGKPIGRAEGFDRLRDADDAEQLPSVKVYSRALRRALTETRLAGVRREDVAAASVFSTMSATSVMERMRDEVARLPVPTANFGLLPGGGFAVFDLSTIKDLLFNRQTSVSGPLSPTSLAAQRLTTLRLPPGMVRRIAYGKFISPSYIRPDATMPTVATFSGRPPDPELKDLYFNIVIPSGDPPATGWPVVIFGHGGGDTMNGAPFNVAQKFAEHGLATAAINLVGHGFGPASSLTVVRNDGSKVTFASGGRAVDVDNDGKFASPEGFQAAPPKALLLGRHGTRQSVIDMMQLVRLLSAGVRVPDVDGSGTVLLDPSRIYYAGFSNGSAVGVLLATIEPRVRASAFIGLGGWPVPQLSPGARDQVGRSLLQERHPPLINSPGLSSLGGVAVSPPFFDENMPARNAPPVVNDVPGAMELQQFFERFEWLSNGGAAGAFAPHLRLKPLPGVPARPFLVQMSRGDQNVPNPITSELARAGDLADRVTLYRHDLFPSNQAFKNPHTFLIRSDTVAPVMRDVALAAQEQLAVFFASDGAEMIDPDETGPLFEAPAAKVPEDFGFIP